MDADVPPPNPVLIDTSSRDISEQTATPLPASDVEELDSFDPLQPPPLDWRSDSSSEEGTPDNLNDFTDSLDKASPDPPVLLPVDVSHSVVSEGQQVIESVQKARVLENIEFEVSHEVSNLNQQATNGHQQSATDFDEHSCIHFLDEQPTEMSKTARVLDNSESDHGVIYANPPINPEDVSEVRPLNQEYVVDNTRQGTHFGNGQTERIRSRVYKIFEAEFEGVYASNEDTEPAATDESLRHLNQEYLIDESAKDFGDVETQISTTAKVFESEFEGIHALREQRSVGEAEKYIYHARNSNQDHTVGESSAGFEDEDHSHIHSLLNKLQLQGEEESYPSHSSPPRAHVDPGRCDFEAHPPSPVADETTGLLFSDDHQQDVVGLLQCTEISSARGGEVDAVVSVSYSPEDTQKYWGRYGKAPPQAQREDSFSSQPDDEYPEPVWMKLGEEPPDQEAAAGSETETDDQPSYKDVPGPCDPEDLLDGVIFGAKYLGSTQLKSDRNPSTNARMAQAQEAVDRIKAPEGESQPMTEVDLFISTKRIKVLTADTQEAMMDHPLQMISYIADIGEIVVLMARRKRKGQESESQKKCLMICHVFTSVDAQVIAQAIGQAFGVAYQQFLQVSGIKASDLQPGEYSHYLESQELYNGDLAHFSDSQNLKEVVITKAPGEILGLAVVESGWGSILPTVVVANLLHGGPAERCGELSIGDRIMSVNGTSLVGLPISTCQNIIRDLKSQKYIKLSIVHCPPVTMAIIRRPDPKYQLGFSVEDGIICSLMRGGIAERGGIRVGHRIIEINGQSVVATTHDKIIQTLTNAVGEIHLKTMPASTYRLLTGQEQPVYL